MRILIVEDDELVADAIKRSLSAAQFVVDQVGSAELAQPLLVTEHFDLAVVDVGLPGNDGLELLRRLRQAAHTLPVLILTARDTLDDKVLALNIGADDFLSKPFEPAELVARCKALLRRASTTVTGVVTLQNLSIDLIGRQLRIDGLLVELTFKEWLVLECLARHVGRIISKEFLLQAISGLDHDVSANALEVYVSRLRGKLGDAATIRSLRGLGYRLEEAKTA